MRIRNYRAGDMSTLLHIWQLAAEADALGQESAAEGERRLALAETEAEAHIFVITDDDDELNQWGQGETLEGVEGEVVGFTLLELLQDGGGYHLRCVGAVHPDYRRQNAGRALLICAMNRARELAEEFEFEAQAQGVRIYFEALLPQNAVSARLAEKCEMRATGENQGGMELYRREL